MSFRTPAALVFFPSSLFYKGGGERKGKQTNRKGRREGSEEIDRLMGGPPLQRWETMNDNPMRAAV